MSRSLAPRPHLFADLFSDFPAWPRIEVAGANAIKVEDEVTDGHYILRAEMPGMDPAKDIDVSISGHLLTIKAERSEHTESKGRSEFTYGSFQRTISLPEGADENSVKATYEKGILTVDLTLPEENAVEAKHVEVTGG
ncbi:MAG: Hsp20/alpha crystallin family protein [Nocardiaceae bacterium]|nr:Hsp20/alpha crystallin family protein [Nocardiaceae bacterium]